jgi:molybdopterin-guanine dinucleotide biosynthesis protein A
VHTRWVLFAELASLQKADRFFDNINTPEDYERVSGKGITTETKR